MPLFCQFYTRKYIICIAACQIISNDMYISVQDNSVARHNLYKSINNALQTRLALKM